MLIGSRVQNRNADMDLTAIAMDIVATARRTAPPVNRPRLFVSRAGCPTAARAPFGQHEEGGALSGDALRFVDCSMCRSSPRASRRPAAQTSRASLRTASPPSGERIQLQLPPNSNSNPNVAATAFAHGGDAMLAMLAMPRSRASPLFFFHVVTLLRPRSQILRDRQHVGGVPAVRRAPYLLPLQSPPRAY